MRIADGEMKRFEVNCSNIFRVLSALNFFLNATSIGWCRHEMGLSELGHVFGGFVSYFCL
jgi:hypothetical protein